MHPMYYKTMGFLKHLSIGEQEFYIMKDDMKVEYDYEMQDISIYKKMRNSPQKKVWNVANLEVLTACIQSSWIYTCFTQGCFFDKNRNEDA